MAEQDKYILNRGWLTSASSMNNEIHTLLSDSFSASSDVYSTVQATDSWTGRSKDAFLAFYHLVLQYHALLVDGSVEDAAGTGKSDYMQRTTDALKSAEKAMDSFCANSTTYTEVEGIS